MRADTTRRRRAVVALLAGTAVLAPAAAYGGYQAGRSLSDDEVAVVAPAPTATASASATAAPSPSQRATELSDEARELAARTAVRLSPLVEGDGRPGYSGSGSIVSADGLVLTNAHVAQPTAPGLATVYGDTFLPFGDPRQLVVSVTVDDGPAVPAYRADVVAVDGYLDLAVLRIVANADGSALPAGTRFPAIPLGSSAALQKGDDLTVYGYPGLTGGELLAVAPGAVRTFVPDPRRIVDVPRFDIETTAEFSAGNSGGMALDNDGRLVAIPRSRYVDEQAVVGRYARPVDLAAPLLEAARNGTAYVSPHVVPSTGAERGEDLGWTDELSCTSDPVDVVAETDEAALGRARLSGLEEGEDVLVVLRRDGEVVRTVTTVFTAADDCYGINIAREADDTLLPGDYRMEVRVGPEQRLLTTSEITVEPVGD